MKYDIENVTLPALAGILEGKELCSIIRPLNDVDKAALEHAKRVYAIALPTTTMFGILHWNHHDLIEFTKSINGERHAIPPQLNANRLILNYISSADALLDHFNTIYKRQCRLNKMPVTGFEELRHQLNNNNDSFQFISMFRNHALHAGLPVGTYTTSNSLSGGKQWKISQNAEELIKWGRGELANCRLLRNTANVDLIEQINRYHETITTKVFNEVVKCFYADLIRAHEFHKSIAAEVGSLGAHHRPAVLTHRELNGSEFKWNFDMLPVDLISELGIKLNAEPQQSV